MKLLKSSLTNFSFIINFIVLTIIAEWIKIPQISVPLNGPQDTLMLSDIPGILHTEPVIKPIRYEDLEHIVGPGFEDELEKFYKKHKNDFETLSQSHTTNLPSDYEEETTYDQYNETIFNEDPWNYYDQIPKATVATTTITTVATENKLTGDRPKNTVPLRKFKIPKPIVPTYTEATTTKSSNSNSTKKKIVKIVKVKQKPKDSETTSLSFNGFLKFLKDIQSSFVFGASRSLKDKMAMLENFRDTLLINIEDRIKSLWPSKVVRTKRSDSHSHSSGMQFPSSEVALMTISFLTFAVFLIKLVLQVINTIKSKHYSYNTFNTFDSTTGYGNQAATTYSVIKKNRNARRLSFSDQDHFKLALKSIDNITKL